MENVPIINMNKLETPDTARALDEAFATGASFKSSMRYPTRHSPICSGHASFFAQKRGQQRLEPARLKTLGVTDRELTKNVRDWKEVFDIGPESGEQRPQWPEMGEFGRP